MVTKKRLIFMDSGPIITLTTGNQLYLLEKFKKRFNIQFIITPSIKKELVDNPLHIKRFQLEAMYVMDEIEKKNLVIASGDGKIKRLIEEISNLANSIILVKGTPMEIIHNAEIEMLAYAITHNIDIVCVDERNTRMIIEDPDLLSKIIGSRLHKKTTIDLKKHKQLKKMVGHIKIIRSAELAIKAVQHDMVDIKANVKKSDLIHAILWNFKLHGCTISIKEIEISKSLV